MLTIYRAVRDLMFASDQKVYFLRNDINRISTVYNLNSAFYNKQVTAKFAYPEGIKFNQLLLPPVLLQYKRSNYYIFYYSMNSLFLINSKFK